MTLQPDTVPTGQPAGLPPTMSRSHCDEVISMLKLLALFILASVSLLAQNPPAVPPTTTTDPTGLACAPNAVLNYVPSGTLFSCQNGAYALVAGTGSGSVTSVHIAGTANEITVTGTCTITTSGTCTLSIPSAFQIPGTINKLTLTQPATGATLTIVDGKTVTMDKTLEFTGTDGVVLTFPATNATIARTDAGQTFTGTQVLTATLGSTSTATTQSQADNSTKVATTAYVDTAVSGSSKQSVFGGSTATNPAFSATPTFSLADASLKSPVRVEPGVMTANVTAVTFTNKTAGAKFSIVWTQDGTGGRTLTYGASASNTCAAAMSTAANASSEQFLEVESDGSTVIGTGCISGDGANRGTELAAPGTPAASQWAFWGDSTNHIFSFKTNNSSTVSNTVVPVTCTNQVMTALSAAGVLTCSTFTLASAQFANQGTTTTVLHGNGAGNPSFGALVSGDLNITTTTCTAPQNVTALSSGAVGTCTAPVLTQNSQSTAYTTVLGDSGKQIYHPATDNNARTFTIDSNANVAYPIGTTITFVNRINTLTIAITSDTMYLGGTASTGSRTLAVNGVATAVKTGTTEWVISGPGLT